VSASTDVLNNDSASTPAHPDPGPAPLLSVTVLNYNYARFLPMCIEAILAQSFEDFELILIDDCSTDNSLEAVEPYRRDPRVRVIDHRSNKGFARSLVEGVEASSGRYLTVISADDLVLSNSAFERQIRLLEASTRAAFCYSAWHRIDAENGLISALVPWDEDHIWAGEREFSHFCTGHYVQHSGTIIRRSAYDAVGGYDTSLAYALDMALWARLCGAGEVAYVAEPLLGYRTHGANMSYSQGAAFKTIREFLSSFDRGFDGLPDCPTKFDRGLRRRARQAALMSVPTMQIFNGNYVRGWQAFLYAVRVSPPDALLQPRLAALMARTALGDRFYKIARKAVLQLAGRRGRSEGLHQVERPART